MTARRPMIRVVGWWVLAVLLTGLAFGLRVHALGVPNLTGDEWFMLRNHDQGPLWIIHQAHTFEPHPLLYYLGLAGWIELAGRSELAMRFPSVAFGVALVPALIGLGRAVIGPRAGLIAGALAALNAYQIAESQNARNYAMVVSLSAVASLLFVRALKRDRRSDWFWYGVAMFLALNTHYDAALVLLVHLVYGGASVWMDKRRLPKRFGAWPAPSRDWLVVTGVVTAAFGGWLLYAWPALLAYHGYFPDPVSLRQVLARSLATFSLGQSASIQAALPAFALAVLGGGWLLIRKPAAAAFLLAYTLLPILVVSVLFLVRPMFDERYLIVLAPGFLVILAAGIEGLWQVAAPIGVVGVVGALAVLVPILPRTYQSMLTDRPDYRAMATWISTDGAPSDPIVATGFGQSELFGYYYHGSQQVQVIDQPAELAKELPDLLTSHDGLWLLPYWQNPADLVALDVLNRDAAPVAQRWFVNARALYFASPRRLTKRSDATGTWDDHLAVERARLTAGEVRPGEAVAAEIHWQVGAPLATPKLSLRLLDDSGTPVAQSDVAFAPGPELSPGEPVTRVGLLAPPALPPGSYRLAVLLYHPDSGAPLALSTSAPAQAGALILGAVKIGTRQGALPPAQAGIALSKPASFPEGLTILGHDAIGPPRAAGETVSPRILWRADRSSLANLSQSLALEDARGARSGAETMPILASYPTSRWRAGQLLTDRIEYQIPPATASGSYQLVLGVGNGPPAVALGSVVVSGPKRTYSPPTVATRIGARFGSFAVLLGDQRSGPTARPGGPVEVTLFWSATGTADRSYTAFVHLVDPSGKIEGQVDRVPVDGTRPTDGWLTGEYLTDTYAIQVAPSAPPGTYHIDVGLYDATSGARVPVVADGTRTDHVVVGAIQVTG
ncbi:MAG: glycosyltransferase family 39 protein [Chloroflexota bacterium]